jgi:DNA invertase Pin-like site-specific DNA recombinase
MSGTSRLSPGYQKLLDEAQRGMFDVVVAEAINVKLKELEAEK